MPNPVGSNGDGVAVGDDHGGRLAAQPGDDELADGADLADFAGRRLSRDGDAELTARRWFLYGTRLRCPRLAQSVPCLERSFAPVLLLDGSDTGQHRAGMPVNVVVLMEETGAELAGAGK